MADGDGQGQQQDDGQGQQHQEQEPAKPPEGYIPRSRLNEAEKARREAQAELDRLKREKEEAELADKSLGEREKARAEKLEAEKKELEQRLTRMERSNVLRDAAAASGIAQNALPTLTKLADYDAFSDEATAKEHVKALLDENPILKAAVDQGGQGGQGKTDNGAGTLRLGQALGDGRGAQRPPEGQPEDENQRRTEMGRLVSSLFG